MIIANGLPKSGTHALMACLLRMGLERHPGQVTNFPPSLYPALCGTDCYSVDELAGLPDSVFVHGHAAPVRWLADKFMVIVILRDPRNVLVSYCRHRQRSEGLDLSVADALRDFWGWGCFVAFYRTFLEWRGLASAVLRYEDMAPGHPIPGGTWTGKPSTWRGWWDHVAEREWQTRGGPELLTIAGY